MTIPVGDGEIVGNLYVPHGYQPDERYPAVVVGGSLTSVKEQMSGTYAAALAARGLLALAIDYRNYGESSGTIRQFEDPELKSDDLSIAAAYLRNREDVAEAGIGLLGVCTSGGTVLYAADGNTDIGAVATVAGWFAEPSVAPTLYGGDEAVTGLRARGHAALERINAGGDNEMVPAYHDTDQSASHVGPMEYYMDATRGGGVAQWRNGFAVAGWENWLDFDPVSHAAQVTAPTMIVHSDGSALPDQARKVYDRLAGDKELVWAEGDHFDFYDQPPQVTASANAVADHFHRHLGRH